MQDHYEVVDMSTWPRAEEFTQYNVLWTSITASMNVKISVAKILPFLKEKGLKFSPVMIWAITRELNKHKTFRYSHKDGQLVLWDKIHPVYPTLTKEGNNSFHCVPFKEDFKEFYADYLNEQEANKDKTSFFATEVPENNYTISIVPWLEFEGAMQLRNPKTFFAPIIVVSKYNEQKILNIMISINHAICDAWHLKLLFEGIQKTLDEPQEWYE